MSDCKHCGAPVPDHVSWCGRCLRPIEPPAPPGAPALHRRVLGHEQLTKPEFSRWRGGPTSFGPVTKIAITVFVIAMGPIGGETRFQVLWAIGYLPIAALVLWGVWRKQRVS